MSDMSSLVETIAFRWNNGLAEQAVQQITAQARPDKGVPGAELQALVERMRQVLREQLARTAVPVEQIRVMEMSYHFEQGLGRRGEALSLAKNLRHLSERKADVLHQIRTAALLAEAWHYVSAIPFAFDWSRRTLQTAKPLEVKGAGGRHLRSLFIAEEVHLAQLMALQGGAEESVDKLLADAIGRYQTHKDRAGQATALAIASQIHMLQGRWAQSVEETRQCLLPARETHNETAAATALASGACSAGCAGDPATARAWIDEASDRGARADDPPTRIAVLSAKASVLHLAGDESAIAVADQAVALAAAWKVELLLRQAMLQRSWLRIAAGRPDPDEMRETTDSLVKIGAAVLEAEAHYALYHALKAAGQDSQAELDKAREQFTTLKMTWHLEKIEKQEPLPNKSA